ncbi:hypothetical protein A3K24_02325 [candidate division Kazan bacterium RIFCSPHIGHO2_01_FULL_44_14]|uniref:Uncharacterized protein n=1 Tax=candidate division Kazan bacterium RIFCSPLOWO2_01_FULL_45_19 TaxID=1798538 RepID=A0A1F4NQB3_UNCK3|nr:hypothetical protein [uncultured bacterium]AQS31078.1 hypothetical protein [uncultured bacterium]OGB73655.1 MAG: hypothetical protein A3K51_02325 [candidate division Kazan bacterium RIFCSPLOWO2_01_FULL_45_19]OGB77900.1 MAG: hypothetical protein A3K24_02325 [candidate division Kazan bacterium RIFCSPHIGHO2_01_FULL_44_14]
MIYGSWGDFLLDKKVICATLGEVYWLTLFFMNKLLQQGKVVLVGLAVMVGLGAWGMGIPNQFIDIFAPIAGDQWQVGKVKQIEWVGVEVAGPYRIEIQRQPMGKWQTIVGSTYGHGMDNGHTAYDWRVTGPVTRRAQIRITDLGPDGPNGPIVGYSERFIIYQGSHIGAR